MRDLVLDAARYIGDLPVRVFRRLTAGAGSVIGFVLMMALAMRRKPSLTHQLKREVQRTFAGLRKGNNSERHDRYRFLMFQLGIMAMLPFLLAAAPLNWALLISGCAVIALVAVGWLRYPGGSGLGIALGSLVMNAGGMLVGMSLML